MTDPTDWVAKALVFGIPIGLIAIAIVTFA